MPTQANIKFGNCCGLYLNHGFWGSARYDQRGVQIEPDLSADRAFFLGEQPNNLVVALRHEQKELFQKELDQNGWRLLHEFWNPNTWFILYLYFRDVDPTKAPGNPKFDAARWKIDEEESSTAVTMRLPAGTKVRYISKK